MHNACNVFFSLFLFFFPSVGSLAVAMCQITSLAEVHNIPPLTHPFPPPPILNNQHNPLALSSLSPPHEHNRNNTDFLLNVVS